MIKSSLIKFWKENFNFSEEVIKAFKQVPREDFVLPEYKHMAYIDNALPILKGQTISQPTTVMTMTNELEVKKGQKILEIGTGSGYQAAILSKLVGPKGKIFTTEIIPELIELAKKNLKNYKNIKLIHSKKELGYKKEAPYDRIIVTAGAKEVPKQLLTQLKSKGIMIIPAGQEDVKNLLKIKNNKIENLGSYVFVPLKI